MEHKKVIEYVFFSIVSGVGTIGVGYVQKISDSMIKLTQNVIELNAKIETVTNRVIRSDESLKDHEERLRVIEKHRYK